MVSGFCRSTAPDAERVLSLDSTSVFPRDKGEGANACVCAPLLMKNMIMDAERRRRAAYCIAGGFCLWDNGREIQAQSFCYDDAA